MLAQVLEESNRTPQNVANLNAIHTKIDSVTQIMSDRSIKEDQHQLQLKAEIEALKVEQSQKEQKMQDWLDQSFDMVAATSSASVTQLLARLSSRRQGSMVTSRRWSAVQK